MSSIMLHKPAQGHSAEVSVQPGRTYQFDFDTDAATFESDAADVVLVFDDGGLLRLKDFLRVTAHDDFILEFPDGTQVSGRDAAHMFAMELDDFHTDGLTASADPLAGLPESGSSPSGPPQSGPPQSGWLDPGLLGDETFAPLCTEVCRVPSHGHGSLDEPEYLITPHADPGGPRLAVPAADSIGHSHPEAVRLHGTDGLDGPERLPGNRPGSAEPLRLDDLLDTSRPVLPDGSNGQGEPNGLGLPVFERLLDAGPGLTVHDGTASGAAPADCIASPGNDGQDPFLLALLGLGPL